MSDSAFFVVVLVIAFIVGFVGTWTFLSWIDRRK